MEKINPFVPDTFCLCHGDFVARNVLFEQKLGQLEIPSVIDWEYSYWGPQEKDIADFLASTYILTENINLSALLEIVEKQGYKVEVIPAMMLHRLLIFRVLIF